MGREDGFNFFNRRQKQQDRELNPVSHEAPPRSALEKIVLWSFDMSQGDSDLQTDIFRAYIMLHPEARGPIRAWRDAVHYQAPKLTDLTEEQQIDYAKAIQSDDVFDWTIIDLLKKKTQAITDEAYASDPEAQKLVAEAKGFISGPAHPAVAMQEGSPGRFHWSDDLALRKATETTKAELETFFITEAIIPEIFSQKQKDRAIAQFAKKAIRRDADRAERATKHPTFSNESMSRARRERGVSKVAKYSLGKESEVVRRRFPAEVQELWAQIGTWVQENKKTLDPVVKERLKTALTIWQQETKEKIKI
jgi:hypothetical protein